MIGMWLAVGCDRRWDVTVRWGVAGTGAVAATALRDLAGVPNAVLTAVGSRSAERAGAFAAAVGHGQVPTAHGSYRALLDDPNVDVVYIATPHPHHRALALAALAAGKAILVEKSFTVTPAATREIVAAAGAAGRFAMEAMWTRFCPAMVRLRELVADGAIGEVRTVTADLGARNPVDPATRTFNPELGDGLLFHLGIYPVSFAQMLLGTPESVVAHGVLHESGSTWRSRCCCGSPAGARRCCSPHCVVRPPGRPGCSAHPAGSGFRPDFTTPTGSCCTVTGTIRRSSRPRSPAPVTPTS
ncbi:MAG TPA: Gfo/Idh/MocA family oxidoreductase [Pseudonocardia sp.]|jgi:predicted dehydrogenase|nr:Gfo/Idh/MocA family oxidoreductase [Pseudonocardia sp.]